MKPSPPCLRSISEAARGHKRPEHSGPADHPSGGLEELLGVRGAVLDRDNVGDLDQLLEQVGEDLDVRAVRPVVDDQRPVDAAEMSW